MSCLTQLLEFLKVLTNIWKGVIWLFRFQKVPYHSFIKGLSRKLSSDTVRCFYLDEWLKAKK